MNEEPGAPGVATPPLVPGDRRSAGHATTVVRGDLDYICLSARDALTTMAGRSLLLTGGAGFLGHYLVLSILHWNRTHPHLRIGLTLLDNFARGVPGWLLALRDEPSLRVIRHDVSRPLPAGVEPCDYVIHAASIASPTFYRRFPIETMDANVLGLRRLLDHILNGAPESLAGFLFLSSSEIYGDPPGDLIPTPETYRGNVSCTGPRACYDESKRFGETLCTAFATHHGLPIRIARPFNNYGPGLALTDRRVVPDLARDILEGRDIVLYSDGSATRTFCYVADAVTGYFKVLAAGRTGEAYNIGTEAPEISIAMLAERMAELAARLFGYTGTVVFSRSDDPAYLVDNPQRRCPSIEKARRELGFEPRIRLDEGLRRSLLWYAGRTAGDEPVVRPLS